MLEEDIEAEVEFLSPTRQDLYAKRRGSLPMAIENVAFSDYDMVPMIATQDDVANVTTSQDPDKIDTQAEENYPLIPSTPVFSVKTPPLAVRDGVDDISENEIGKSENGNFLEATSYRMASVDIDPTEPAHIQFPTTPTVRGREGNPDVFHVLEELDSITEKKDNASLLMNTTFDLPVIASTTPIQSPRPKKSASNSSLKSTGRGGRTASLRKMSDDANGGPMLKSLGDSSQYSREHAAENQLWRWPTGKTSNDNMIMTESMSLRTATIEIIENWLKEKLASSDWMRLVTELRLLSGESTMPQKRKDKHNRSHHNTNSFGMMRILRIDPQSLQKNGGLSQANVARLYRSLWIYSVGFHELLMEITKNARSVNVAKQIRASVWKTYAILLEEYMSTDEYIMALTAVEKASQRTLSELTGVFRKETDAVIKSWQETETAYHAALDKIAAMERESNDLHAEKTTLLDKVWSLDRKLQEKDKTLQTARTKYEQDKVVFKDRADEVTRLKEKIVLMDTQSVDMIHHLRKESQELLAELKAERKKVADITMAAESMELELVKVNGRLATHKRVRTEQEELLEKVKKEKDFVSNQFDQATNNRGAFSSQIAALEVTNKHLTESLEEKKSEIATLMTMASKAKDVEQDLQSKLEIGLKERDDFITLQANRMAQLVAILKQKNDELAAIAAKEAAEPKLVVDPDEVWEEDILEAEKSLARSISIASMSGSTTPVDGNDAKVAELHQEDEIKDQIDPQRKHRAPLPPRTPPERVSPAPKKKTTDLKLFPGLLDAPEAAFAVISPRGNMPATFATAITPPLSNASTPVHTGPVDPSAVTAEAQNAKPMQAVPQPTIAVTSSFGLLSSIVSNKANAKSVPPEQVQSIPSVAASQSNSRTVTPVETTRASSQNSERSVANRSAPPSRGSLEQQLSMNTTSNVIDRASYDELKQQLENKDSDNAKILIVAQDLKKAFLLAQKSLAAERAMQSTLTQNVVSLKARQVALEDEHKRKDAIIAALEKEKGEKVKSQTDGGEDIHGLKTQMHDMQIRLNSISRDYQALQATNSVAKELTRSLRQETRDLKQQIQLLKK